MAILAVNKRANFDYEILETYEAGLVLFGHEVKSVKTGHVSLKGSYVVTKSSGKALPELYLLNAYIPPYQKASNVQTLDPYRSRKLLLHKKQIRYLLGKSKEQGLTLIPIKIYTKRSFLKIEFGIGKGKKKVDKREDIKKRDLDRSIRSIMKRK